MGFNFGAPTPAPAPATGGTTGGFSFGATPAPAAASATTAPASTGGFSFGAAPAATAPTPAAPTAASSTPAPATGGFSFGAAPAPSATTAATSTTAAPTATPAAAPAATTGFSFGATPAPATVTTTAITSTNPSSNPVVSPPPTMNSQSSATTMATAAATMTIPSFESSFPNLAMHSRLETLLENIQSPHAALSEIAYHGQELMFVLKPGGNGNGSEVQSFGDAFCHPNPCKNNVAPNMTLRNQLSTNPLVQLPSQTQGKPTALPNSILRDVMSISDLLNISEEDAGALYGASMLGKSNDGDGGVNYALDQETLGHDTVHYFDKRHMTPSTIGGFVSGVISRAQENDCYIQPIKITTIDGHEKEMLLHNAMDLYYLERGQILRTLLMLLHHRISASHIILSSRQSGDENGDNDGGSSELEQAAARIVFEATDPLLDDGKLVMNLIQLVRDLTIKNEALASKICTALDQREMGQQNGPGSATPTSTAMPSARTGGLFGAATPAPAPPSGLFGGSTAFGTTPTAPPAATTSMTPGVDDQDYAMYEFTFQQRQMACQCLFYIAYHTQCEMEEVTSLLDLVKDLTNGSTQLGTGLPILDPIRDVPDPYILSWNKSNMANDTNNIMGMNMGMMQPQQIKTEKKHQDWKKELITSLWSVKGLSRATVTTFHEDFNGNRMYHAITRKATASGTINTNVTMGNANDDVVIGGGKPQLMQCVTTLILTVMCTFEGTNVLIDRKVHGPNAFGEGNALILKATGGARIHNDNDISTIHEYMSPIRDRLDASPGTNGLNQWKRQDIAGLLSASFALMLRPATDVLSSPGGPPPPGGLPMPRSTRRRSSSSSLVVSSDMNNTFRSCLESPAMVKSITFARTSLIPCLGTGSMKSISHTVDNDFAFFMSVLADFTAQYLDAICSFGRDLPISRARWLHEEEQELQLRKVQEHRMKEYMEISSGQSYDQIQLPDEVDITNRPDCIDDMVALAVTVCSNCPESSSRFWKQMEGPLDKAADTEDYCVLLKPSRIMTKLEKHQAKDESLLPVYISFLSAVALTPDPNNPSGTENGAKVVHEFLSDIHRMQSSPSVYDPSKQITWKYLLTVIRWYAQQLNPPVTEKSQNNGWGGNDAYKQSSTYSEDSTAYYYGAEDNSVYSKSQKDKGGSGLGGSSSLSQSSAKKELDESDTMTLMGIVRLISHVAMNSSKSRQEILDIKLPITGGKRFETMEDDALTILFTLLVTSISPEMRGQTLTAISNLIRQDDGGASLSKEQKERGDDLVLRCWELLESTQVVPVGKLVQYDNSIQQSSSIPAYQTVTKNGAKKMFPPSEEYGIIYEMEFVENRLGAYPATEGLLKLLTVLFSTEICPSNLGANWRVQTGCSPYIEYVTDYILPRIMQTNAQSDKLYFATSADKSRLMTRALEVIDAVITRYIPPSQGALLPLGGVGSEPQLVAENSLVPINFHSKSTDKTIEENLLETVTTKQSKAGMNLVISSIFPKCVSDDRLSQFSLDFATDGTSNTVENGINSNSNATQPVKSNVPRSKSPGFGVVGDILSSNGALFEMLIQLLVEQHNNSVRSGTFTCDESSFVLSLFGDTSPDFVRAKAGRDYLLDEQKNELSQLKLGSLASGFVRAFLSPLGGESIEDVDDTPLQQSSRSTAALSDAQLWREHCILLVMRIICAAAARDDIFSSAIAVAKGGSCQIVPVMRFQAREYNLRSPLYVKNIQPIKLPKLIFEKSFQSEFKTDFVLSILSKYIGYQSTSLQHTNAIASFAMSLVKYLCGCSHSKVYIKSLCGISPTGMASVATTFATRLSLGPLLKNETNEISLNEEILDLLLRNLKLRGTGGENLAHIILGLAGQTTEQKRQYLQMTNDGTDVEICSHHNALDAILALLSDVDFILDPKTSSLAPKCFEIIYRLCDPNASSSYDPEWLLSHICVVNKLRKAHFWQSQLVRFLGSTESSESILSMIMANSPTKTSILNGEICPTIERDGNVLHCVSWLLKGVSLELHALVGASSELVSMSSLGKLPSLSPQPLKCTQLIELLLDENSSIILQALSALPLVKPLLARALLMNAPPRELLMSASINLEGPSEICEGFTAIDPQKLNRSVRESRHGLNEDEMNFQLDEANLWARVWNVYVHFACASYHIAKAWSLITSTIFSSCRELLVSSISNSRAVAFDCNSATLLLKSILSRIIEQSEQKTGNSTSNESLDAGAIYEISSSVIPIVQVIIDLQMLSGNDPNMYMIGADDAMQIISLLVDAILCNSNGDDDGEMAAIFSSILSAVLESDLYENNVSIANFSFQMAFRNKALRAASLLARLSIAGESSTDKLDQHPLSIARAARSGLSSLISWFNAIEEAVEIKGKSFLRDLFLSGTQGTSLVSNLIHPVAENNDDSLDVIANIACYKEGAQILVDEGISEAILSASSVYLRQVESQQSMYRSFNAEFPEFIYSHVSVLNTILSSDLSPHSSQRLMVDTAKFLSMHQQTIDRLVTSFPANSDMALSFATTIALLSIAVCGNRNEIDGRDRFEQIFHVESFPAIELRIVNFALHVAQFPFPSSFLSPLPNQLVQVLRRQNIHLETDKNWWDIANAVRNESNLEDLPLPNPPSASDTFYSSQGKDIQWSQRMYDYARSAAQYLDLCLLHLENRVSRGSNDSIPIADLNLSLALCRYSRAAWEVGAKLQTLVVPDERDISSLLTFANIGSQSNGGAMLRYTKQIEVDQLQNLGYFLASCVSKLLYLIKRNVDETMMLLSGTSSIQTNESLESIKERSMLLLVALDDSQIASRGIGCINMVPDALQIDESSKLMVNELLITLSNICR